MDGAGTPEQAGPAVVRSWEVDHPSGAPALAVRVDLGGSGFGYSGDTAWTPSLSAAARGTDVFACEAYTYRRHVPYHLDHEDVREHGHELDTSRLVLTHLGPTMLAALAAPPDEFADDGLVLET